MKVKALGVKIETDVVVGKSVTIDELLTEEGFDAVFIGSGAGLPKFMGIPGEALIGVCSANEYLTRINLMKGYLEDYDTPVIKSKSVAVVGGGNVAMERMKKMKLHKGLRHYFGLRVRGQHTCSTGRRGKTVGVSKKK